MKIDRAILVPMFLLLPVSLLGAQWENLEIGLYGGVGFYWGQRHSAEGISRTTKIGMWLIDAEDKAKSIPGFEAYGALVRYRIDNHWNVALKGTRQRLFFREYKDYTAESAFYYNAAWNVDVTAEYDILDYGHSPWNDAGSHAVACTPYVLLGVGVSLYNENASYRGGNGTKEKGSFQPRVGDKALGPVRAACYIPVGAGIKWRVARNWQLQVSAQYHLYVQGADLSGYTEWVTADNVSKPTVGSTHDILVVGGVIYNFGKWRQRNRHCMCEDDFNR